jgi:hypothetical protein
MEHKMLVFSSSHDLHTSRDGDNFGIDSAKIVAKPYQTAKSASNAFSIKRKIARLKIS